MVLLDSIAIPHWSAAVQDRGHHFEYVNSQQSSAITSHNPLMMQVDKFAEMLYFSSKLMQMIA
jgi:hypothetical protein